MISQNHHESPFRKIVDVAMDAKDEGRAALDTLRRVVDEWSDVFDANWLLLADSQGSTFYERKGTAPAIRYSLPLAFYGTPVATIFSSRSVELQDSYRRMFTAELAMALNMVQRWAETEAERRGEKIHRVMQLGLTEENVRLLDLCGLADPPWGIIAISMTQHIPFQHMHQMRRFFLGRIWGYRDNFPFVGWIPNGLLAILSMKELSEPTTFLTKLTNEWDHAYPSFPVASYWSLCQRIDQLPSQLQRTRKIMDYALQEHHQGFLNRIFDQHAMGFLINLPRESLLQLVREVLQPIMDPGHRDILITLREYLFHHQSVDQAARVLYVHKNTVIYRVHQAENLLHHDFRNTECVAEAWMAFQALSLLRLEQLSVN